MVFNSLRLYSSYRGGLGVFLYCYFHFCGSVKGFSCTDKNTKMKAYFKKFPPEFAGAAGWMLFVCLFFEFVLVDKFTVNNKIV